MFGSCQFLLTVGFKELGAVVTPPQLFILINTRLYYYLQLGMRDVAPRVLAMLGQHDDFLIPLGMRRYNTSFLRTRDNPVHDVETARRSFAETAGSKLYVTHNNAGHLPRNKAPDEFNGVPAVFS